MERLLLDRAALWCLDFLLMWNTIDAHIRYTIPEELSVGSVVGNLAKDLGFGVAEISDRNLRISTESGKQYFSVDLEKGELAVNERIDREELCGQSTSCLMPLEVIIENPLQLYRVEIEVQDINDNAPHFHTKEIILKIAESTVPGARFLLEMAQDPDVGSNSLRSYSLHKNDHFSLNVIAHKDGRKVPELVLQKALDRENLSIHKLILTAVDGGIPATSGSTQLTIQVLDINDNTPVFSNALYEISVNENTPKGTVIGSVKATDLDEGSNGDIEFSFASRTLEPVLKTFSINPFTGEIALNDLIDYEGTSSFTFDIRASDKGSPSMESHCTVRVDVLDINDNVPEIILKSLPSPIKEDAEDSVKGTPLIRLLATDLDEGANGEILYSFGEHMSNSVNSIFHIDSNTGEMFLKGELDYESAATYRIEVVATDKGSPEMEGHCSVQVEIVDVNDNPPEVVLTSSPSPVREDAPIGTVVALISARDLDSGDNGKVSLQIPLEYPFALKPSVPGHYALVTNGMLDRESFPEYNIEVTATDAGSPPLTSKKTIPIKILDVNDNPPSFLDSFYNVYLTENNAPGSILGEVSAVDPDLGENAKISYSILDSKMQDASVSSYVYINSDNGSIYSMHSFDYEKLKVFQIHVQAKDHGSPSLSSNVTVHVFILDQNDNVPAVIYPFAVMGSVSHQKMPRSAKAGHLVTKVTAVDADSGHNAWVSYKLVEATDASLFSVNLYTGEVRTKRAVSEQDDSSHRLLIEIKDNGEPVQSATVTVGISLEDGVHEPILDFRQHKSHEPASKSNKITFYLIVSLASVSAVSFLTFAILAVRCIRSSASRACCCVRRGDSDEYNNNPNRNLHIQLNTDGPIKYVEVLGGDMLSQSQSFRSCLSPVSEFSDFTFVKPSSTTDFKEMINVLDASLPDSAWTFESQQVRHILLFTGNNYTKVCYSYRKHMYSTIKGYLLECVFSKNHIL
uniref:Protocadherin 1 gamma 31 n=2 Tax=Scleropages formosus TaxID=113540 RepID=A0A8C9QYQ0_SCLFO